MKIIPSRSARPTAGFTLIELLTVIAIIGILAAIIIPTVSKVRETAKSSLCLSNLRGWAMAVQAYSADNKGNYYISELDGSIPWTQISAESRNPYKAYFRVTRDFGTFGDCPTLPNLADPTFKAAGRNTPDYFSYTLVRPWSKLPTNLAPLNKVPLAQAENPSRTLLLFERHFTEQGLGTPNTIATSDQGPAMRAAYSRTYTRHNGWVNAVAMDMHAMRLQWEVPGDLNKSLSATGGTAINPTWFALRR